MMHFKPSYRPRSAFLPHHRLIQLDWAVDVWDMWDMWIAVGGLEQIDRRCLRGYARDAQ